MKLFTKIILILKKCNRILFSIYSGLLRVVSLIRCRTQPKSKEQVCMTITQNEERKEEYMITANQVAYWSLQEQIRSNQAKELETNRANVAKEEIALIEAKETHRANVAKEVETNRHNVNTEVLDFSDGTPASMAIAAGIYAGQDLFETIGNNNTTDVSKKDSTFTHNTSNGGGGKGGRAGRKEK